MCPEELLPFLVGCHCAASSGCASAKVGCPAPHRHPQALSRVSDASVHRHARGQHCRVGCMEEEVARSMLR